jgi:competence ComEA-like helix-hairpin-helix protein
LLHLTSQEKTVLTGLCVVVFVGLMVHIGLQKDLKLLEWMDSSKTKITAVNINQARTEDLLRVPGIGPKTAQFILNYRRHKGKFTSLEPLKEAKGMTPQRYERVIRYLKI